MFGLCAPYVNHAKTRQHLLNTSVSDTSSTGSLCRCPRTCDAGHTVYVRLHNSPFSSFGSSSTPRVGAVPVTSHTTITTTLYIAP